MQAALAMKFLPLLCCLPFGCVLAGDPIPNPKIDYGGFIALASDLEKNRETNRVSEDEFIRLSKEPGTVILDARSKDRYEALHIKGAIHLAFTDFTEPALRKLIPDTATRILIYCNNNFENEPVNFASKSYKVALNIQTFINLHAYGYKNVKELGPLLDVKKTKIEFGGTDVPKH
jgi:hypothetical protein